MNIFIVGCGKIGSAFARERMALGDALWGLRRQRADPDPDTDTDTDTAAAADTGACPMLYAETAQEAVAVFQALQVQPDLICVCANPGLRGGGDNQLLSLSQHICAAFPQARYIYTSSTFVYADAPGVLIAEDGPFNTTAQAQQLRAIEDVFVDLPSSVVLRLSAIVGPGREHLRKRIREAYTAGQQKFALRGPLDRRFNFIHESNVIELLHAFTDAHVLGRQHGIFNCSSPIEMSLREYVHALMQAVMAEQAGASAEVSVLPMVAQGPEMADRIIDSQKLVSHLRQHAVDLQWRTALAQ